MRYGKRERIVGAIIIIALAVILLPMLFGDPAPRDEGPAPTMTIEQPIDVSRDNVAAPSSPLPDGDDTAPANSNRDASNRSPVSQTSQLLPSSSAERASERMQASEQTGAARDADEAMAPAATERSDPSQPQHGEGNGSDAASREDPILAAASQGSASVDDASASDAGGWAVQAGSFGEAGNADRLVEKLDGLGFSAYKRPRNNLQTVYVGPYESSEAGERARTQLQQRANIKGLVVRRDSNSG